AIGFEHCVANMYFIPTGIILESWAGIAPPSTVEPNALGWVSFLWKNLLPVTIGNIIGGAVFVGMSYGGAFLRLPSKPKNSAL
ncbi:MAG: formate/nitrite transporter family protein, partial [Proteobacteria bacterium]|nr:formate/nitrite transporter family protein [Pseudomonadota bacterium]